MDEAIIDFLSCLEDVIQKATIVQELLEEGEIETSGCDIETFGGTLEEQINMLQELQGVLNLEIDNAPLDFDE